MAGLIDAVDGVSKLRDHLASERHAKLTANWAAYADVMKSLALGEDVDAAEMAIVLAMVDKTPDDLSEDLEKFKRRLEWRAQLDTLPGLTRDLAKAAAAFQSAQAEFDRVVGPLQERVTAAHAAKTALENAISAAGMGEGFLRSSVQNPALLDAESRLQSRQLVLRGQLADLRERQSLAVGNAEAARHNAAHSSDHRAHYLGHAEIFDKRARDVQPEIDALESEIEKGQRQLEALQAQKLQP